MYIYLESTDTALEVPHPHPTRLPARRSASSFFFFFFFLGFVPTRLDSCRIGFNSRRTRLIRPESGCIGHIRSYPKSALNMAGKAETCLLLYFFCELRHSDVFFKNILIVKIYIKYNKNIFNNFLIVESRCTCNPTFSKIAEPCTCTRVPKCTRASYKYIYIYIYIFIVACA